MLFSIHDAALAESVTAVLSAVVDEEYAAYHGKTIAGYVDCLLQASVAIHRAADAAIAAFNEEWNAVHCDPVLRLPHELAVECLSYLDFGERILVSHVSRAWRAMIQSEPSLWTDVRLSPLPLRAGVGALVTLLDRSAPLPVSFRMGNVKALSSAIVEDVINVFLQNVERFKLLGLFELPDGAFANLLDQDGVGLRVDRLLFFPKTAASAACSPPPLAPIPQRARLSLLNSLRELSGCITEAERFDLRSVWDLCPSLRVLEVDGLATNMLERLNILHAPQSLSVLRLNANRDAGRAVAYDAFLRSCVERSLSETHIGSALNASTALQLFAQMAAGRWSLEFRRSCWVIAKGLDFHRSCTITVSADFNPRFDNSFLHSVSRLAELSLSLWHLFVLAMVDTWPRVLPSLRVLAVAFRTIDVGYGGDLDYMEWPEGLEKPITSPELRSITLVAKNPSEESLAYCGWAERAAWVSAHAAPVLRRLFFWPDAVDTVTVEIAQPQYLMDVDLTSVRALGRTLVVRNQRTGEETKVSVDLRVGADPAVSVSQSSLAASIA